VLAGSLEFVKLGRIKEGNGCRAEELRIEKGGEVKRLSLVR